MSNYIKTEWKTGDVITAEKLNNIENGIANGSPMVVSVDVNAHPTNPNLYSATITTPWEEIANAFNSGQTVLVQVGTNTTTVMSVGSEDTGYGNMTYSVTLADWMYNKFIGPARFTTDAPDGEPSYTPT